MIINQEALAAEDNWKFLLCLEQPCQQLHKAHPTAIPDLLPHILSCVRMIWNVSRFYNTPERITVLLRKLSNEIILRCCSIISLNDVFQVRTRRWPASVHCRLSRLLLACQGGHGQYFYRGCPVARLFHRSLQCHVTDLTHIGCHVNAHRLSHANCLDNRN